MGNSTEHDGFLKQQCKKITQTILKKEKKLGKLNKVSAKNVKKVIITDVRIDIPNCDITRCKFSEKEKILRRAIKEDFMYNGSFHEAIGPVLVVAQIFGMLPVNGIRAKDVNLLSFSWTSCRTIYSIIVFIFYAAYCYIVICYVFTQTRIDFENVSLILFWASGVYIQGVLINLARKWPDLMKVWRDTENRLPALNNNRSRSKLANRMKIMLIIFITLGLSEHLLMMATVIHFANYCPFYWDPFKDFSMALLYPLFYYMGFSKLKAFFGIILNFWNTFSLKFVDLFLILMSIGISSGYERINDCLLKIKGKQMSDEFWCKQRQNYHNLATLCQEVDNVISHLIMVVYSNNLYFICKHLLRSLSHKPSIAHTIYFWFSLLFIIGRTLALSLYSSNINDMSKFPATILQDVPSKAWSIEAKRFWLEVNISSIALSGMRFFFLTRKLILSIVGTIITYELVLFQFNEDKIDFGCQ